MNSLCSRLLAAVLLTAAVSPRATAASFQIQGVSPVAAVRGTSPPAMTASFTVTAAGTTQAWTASLEGSPAWASLSATSGTGAGSVTVNFNTTSLAAGTFNSALVLTSGGTVSRAAFALTVITPNVIKMEADLNRPVIYALHRGTEATNPPGYVIFLNTATEKVELVRPAGVNPTDFDISYPEGKLFVSNHGATSGSVRVIDLTTREQVRTMNAGTDVYKLNAGRNGRLVAEGLDQWVNASLLNSVSGATITTVTFREGDGEFDPTGRYYYHCDNNNSDADISRHDTQTDAFVTGPTSVQHAYGSRNLVMAGDGSRLFWQGYGYDRDLNELRSYGAQIHATTFRGEIVFSENRAYAGSTGAQLATLPVTTTQMAVSGDQTKLFLFNTATGAFTRVLMSAIGPVPPPVSAPLPADQAAILTPLSSLQWSSAAGALSYRVYLGMDSAAVAAADTASPLYLGETAALQRTVPSALVPGTTYYWRVDPVGFSGASTGPVWRFTTSALVVSPNALNLKMPRGSQSRTIPLTTAAAVPGPWTASESLSWLTLSATSGTSGDGLTATVNVTGLAAGIYSGAVSFSFGGVTAQLPVSLEVFTLALSKMTADPSRPWIYGLHPGTATQPESYVIFINTATRQIENALQTGSGATDLTINHQEGRLYVSNWQGTSIQVVDLTNQTLLAPIPSGRDVYKLNAGRAGRLYAEEQDQWIYASMINAATGAVIGNQLSLRAGDAQVDPSGRYYYHCDSSSSGATITKYDVSSDEWTLLKTSLVRGYGSQNLVMSQDGSRLFWQGRVYDADLNELRELGAEIYATSVRGELAVTENKVLNTTSGLQLATLPVTTTVSAVAADHSALYYFNATTGAVGFVPMSSIAPLTVPGAGGQPADNATVLTPVARLSWDVVPSAINYRVYIGTSRAAVAAATVASPEYAGETVSSFWALPAGTPAPGATLYWRVDPVGISSVSAGPVWSFTASALVITPQALTVKIPRGAPARPVAITTTAGAPGPWTASESLSWLSLSATSGTSGEALTATVNPAGLTAGSYSGVINFTFGGLTVPLPVSMDVFTLNLSKMTADPGRPWIYGLHPGTATQPESYVVFINTATRQIGNSIQVGMGATDLSINHQEGRLYVSNWQRTLIQAVNLADQTLLAPIPSSRDVYILNAGRAGRLYSESQDQWVDLAILNAADGSVIRSSSTPGFSFSVRAGDGEADPSGRYYYHADPYGFTKYDVSADAWTSVKSSTVSSGYRNLVMSQDGLRLFTAGRVFDADLNELRNLGTEIYSTTLRGELAVTDTKVLNTSSGALLATLPVTTTVSAVAGDQSALFYFNSSTGTIGSVLMSSIAPVPVPGANAQPANNATVLTPLARLSWDVVPAALRYAVYYGASQAAVAAATTTSPEYAGETLDNFWPLPAGTPAPGTTLYWRVDYVGLTATTAGTVRSFRTLPVSPGTALVEGRSIRGAVPTLIRLPVTGLAATTWTASTSGASWLRVLTPSGTTGDTLELELTPGSLAAATYTGSVTLSAGGLSVSVAVKFAIEAPNYIALLADPDRTRLYALQRPAATLTGSLVVINSSTSAVERVIPVSDNPSDFALTPDNAFLYIVTRGGRKMHRVNLTDWSTGEKPLGTSADHSDAAVRYRVAAGAGTMVYWVDGEWGPRLHSMDFATGAETGPAIQANTSGTGIGDIARTGDGTSLTGWTQYGWSAGTTGSQAILIDTSGVSAVIASAGTSLQRDPLDAPVLPRADGSAVFMKKFKLSADLGSVITEYPSEIYAVTPRSGVVFGESAAWRERTVTSIWQAPAGVSARICAVTGDQTAFYYFNTATGALVRVALSSLGDVPGPAPENGEIVSAMPTELSWTPNAQAVRYEVYFGTDLAGVTAAAGSSSPYHLGTSTEAEIPFSTPFETGGIWWWRVDTVLAGSTVKGAVWRFSGALTHITKLSGPGTSANEAPALALEGTTLMAGYPLVPAAGSSGYAGLVHVHRKRPGHEEWYLHQTIQKPAAAAADAHFGSAIALMGEIAWIGARNDASGGKAYEYRLDNAGLWQPTGRSLQSPEPTSGGLFGSRLAFDGSVLAAGIPRANVGTNIMAGAVELFNTATLTRIVRITDSSVIAHSSFGNVLSMDQGVLAIGSPNRNSTTGYVEVWTRSGTTWSRTAMLSQTQSGFGESVAVTGTQILVGSPSRTSGTPGRLYIYQRGAGNSWSLASQAAAAGPPRPETYAPQLAAYGSFAVFGTVLPTYSTTPGTAWLYRNTLNSTWEPVAPAITPALPSSYSYPRYADNVAVNGRYLAATYGAQSSTIPGVSIFLHNAAGNLPPRFTSGPVLYAEPESPYSYRLTGADENAGDQLNFVVAGTLPAWLSLTDHGDGTATLAGSVPAGFTGDIPVSISLQDDSDDSARQSFTLRVLPAGSIPRITAASGSQTSDDGKRVTLSVTVAPGGTPAYQWYQNGILLSGRTAASLVLENVQASDAGSYHVRVTQNGVWVDSNLMELTVNQVPDRFGGDWPTFGAGNSRSGYYPAALTRHKFLPGWTAASAGRNPVATGSGRVYASVGGGFDASSGISAFSLHTGQKLWTTDIPAGFSMNPPAFHRGKVYVQRGKNTSDSPDLRSFDAATGTLQWTAPFDAQWESYYAPAVDDTGIFVNGGTYGGMYGFNLDGTQRFFTSVGQFDDWTPLLHNGGLYSWVSGAFSWHDRNSGLILSTVTLPWSWSGYSMNTIPAAEGDIAVMHSTTELAAVNLKTRRVLWQKPGGGTTSPAIRNGIVYSITAGAVASFDALTGIAGRVYETRTAADQPATGIHQPVILDDTLLISTWDNVWSFELATGTLLQRLTGGGPLTYTDGVLLASGFDGTLRTWKVNQPARIDPQPVLAATEDVLFTKDIAIGDPDADTLNVSVTGLPAWLTAQPFSGGIVRISGTPLNPHAGAFSFTITADDGQSFPGTLTVDGSVLAVNDQPMATAPAPLTSEEDSALPPLTLADVFSDEEDAPEALVVTVSGNTNPGLFSSVSIAAGQLRLVLTPDASGTATLDLTATDTGGLTVKTTLAVTILPVNDRPVATAPAPLTVDEDAVVPVLNLATVFGDVEDGFAGLNLALTGNTSPGLFSSVAISGGQLLMTLAPNAFGAATLTLTATDTGGLSVAAELSVTILPVNDRPAATPPAAIIVDEDAILAPLALGPVFSDVEDGFAWLTIAVTGNTSPGLFSSVGISGGQLVIVLTPDASGAADLTLTATDSGGLSVETMVSLTVRPVSDQPRRTPNPAPPVIPADGSAFSYSAALLFTDPDPEERLTYTVVNVDRPELFASLTLDPATGLLSADWKPYVWGTAIVTLRATGLDGLAMDTTVRLNLDAPPAPSWRLDGGTTLNRQTGLMEQKIIVTNTGLRAIAGFELWIQTGAGTSLYNGMTAEAAGAGAAAPAPWMLPYGIPLAAGQQVSLVVEFHHPARQPGFSVAGGSVVNPLASAWPVAQATGAPFGISRVLPSGNAMLIEFPATPGTSYRIEYSTDNRAWSTCPTPS